MRGRLRAALAIVIALTPGGFAGAAPASEECGAGDVARALQVLDEAGAFARARGLETDRGPEIQRERKALRESPCYSLELAQAWMTAAQIHLEAKDLPAAARLIREACRHNQEIPEAHVDCLGQLLTIHALADQLDELRKLAPEIRRLADSKGVSTTSVISLLLSVEREKVTADRMGTARGIREAIDVLASDEIRRTLKFAKLRDEAWTQLNLGNFGPGLASAREAHALLEKDLDLLTILGTLHLSMGQTSEALRVLHEGVAALPEILAEAKDDPTALAMVRFFEAKLHAGRATAQLVAGDAVAARQSIARAWEASRGTPLEGLGEFLGLPRLEAQALLAAEPRSAEAAARARELIAGRNDPVGARLLELTETLLASVDPKRVSDLLKSTEPLLATASRAERIELHARLARALARAGDAGRALAQWASALALVEEASLQSSGSAALPAFFSRYVDLYAEAVEVLYGRFKAGGSPGDAELALRYSEAAHARRFSERYGPVLMESFGVRAGVPESVRRDERELRERLGRASRPGALDLVASPVQVRMESEDAAKRYIEFVETARSRYRDYAAFAFPRPLGARDLPPDLNGKFLVSYLVTDAAIYWWVVSDRRIVAFERSALPRASLREAVAKLVDRINDPHPALCEALVRGPFARIAELAPSGSPARVIVIPDDVLYAVPWEALCGLKEGSLGEEIILSYAPSLTVLSQAVGARAPEASARSAFVVGDTQDSDTTVPGIGTFPELPKEPFELAVRALQGAGFATTVLRGSQATQEELFARKLEPYSLLHFDTHAFAISLEPPPSLILHPSAGAPLGLFTLADVARLRLRSRLVTLSACQTALGKESEPLPGEGVEALARAFMLAGSKSVLATLWNVNSDAAAALAQGLYRELGGGAPDLATALFRARAEVRRRFPYREHWASFILIGDPGR